MATTVVSGTVDDADGYSIADDNNYFFRSTSFIRATGTNDEGITVENGAEATSVVTVAGDVIGNRVGIELDGSDVLFVTQAAVVRDERAFGIRTLGADNQVTVAGFVAGNDIGVELDGDNDRLIVTRTGTIAGAADPDISFRPAGVNLRGEDNVLENAGTISAGGSGEGRLAVTNRIFNSVASSENDVLDSTVLNTGQILGDVRLFAGSDIYDGRGGGFVSGIIYLGADNDYMRGGDLRENVRGGDGVDRMTGRRGDDTLFGDDGNDRLRGGADDDELDGGAGRDDLRGGSGDDVMRGGIGNDTLTGDSGNDRMAGEGGGDTFVFGNGFGCDVIEDFRDANTVRLDVSAVSAIVNFHDLKDNHLSQDGTDAIITAGNDTIRLENFAAADLDFGDFIF